MERNCRSGGMSAKASIDTCSSRAETRRTSTQKRANSRHRMCEQLSRCSALPTQSARGKLPDLMNSLQPDVERRGEEIFRLVDEHPESIFTKAGFYQRMMAFSMRDEEFKVQLFRFVDVLAALHHGGEIVR